MTYHQMVIKAVSESQQLCMVGIMQPRVLVSYHRPVINKLLDW